MRCIMTRLMKGKEMMRAIVNAAVIVVLTYGGPTIAQNLPDDILADLYLLEATKALQRGDTHAAIRGFGKIEALNTEPPLVFLYFYGKLLVENSTALDDLLKGQSLLKQYVLNIEKGSEHYTPTLELLSLAGAKLEKAEAERKAREAAERERKAKERTEAERIVREETERKAGEEARETRLFDAVELGKAEVVKALLAAGVNVHAKGYRGRTPLHIIAFHDRRVWTREARMVSVDAALRVTEVLLAAGANVHVKDDFGRTPLHFIGETSNPTLEIAKSLLNAGANIHAKDNAGKTPLYHAVGTVISEEGIELIKLLITAGADVNTKDNQDYTPLHEAASARHKAGDPTSQIAYDNIRVEVLKILLAAGADVDVRNKPNQTPLHRAAFNDNPGVAETLLAAGAAVTAKDRSGRTPLNIAVGRNNTRTAKVLKTHATRH